jgi:hypothetical protein
MMAVIPPGNILLLKLKRVTGQNKLKDQEKLMSLFQVFVASLARSLNTEHKQIVQCTKL